MVYFRWWNIGWLSGTRDVLISEKSINKNYGGVVSILSYLKFESHLSESALPPNVKLFDANPNLVKPQYEYRISNEKSYIYSP